MAEMMLYALAVGALVHAQRADDAPAQERDFRGVFVHAEKTMSINIRVMVPSSSEARITEARVHVEAGCIGYNASGYRKGSRLILLPIGDTLGEEVHPVMRELGVREYPSFDIASLICHLDQQGRIESVDIVRPDLRIYKVKRDFKTAHDPDTLVPDTVAPARAGRRRSTTDP